MAYKILHLPTATFMYHSLMEATGKTNTTNFYTQYEIDNGFYTFNNLKEKPTQLFKTKSMATRFLDRWEKLKSLENNGNVDELIFDEDTKYVFSRAHFSIIKVENNEM
jgi:hypothetical protein